MKIWFAVLGLLIGLTVVAAESAVDERKDLLTIQKQLADFFSDNEAPFNIQRDERKSGLAKRLMREQNEDGSWPGINMTDKSKSHWKPIQHLSRVRQLSAAYYSGGSTQKEVWDAAVKGLRYWVKVDPKSDNWWNQSIGTPMNICEALILLGNDIPDDLRAQLQPILDRSKPGMTGQNRVWLSGIHIMKGVVNGKADMVRQGRDNIANEIVIVPLGKEGLQKDFSYHQHGSQMQFGNYGLAFFSDATRWVFGLRGTAFAFPAEKEACLIGYYRHGLAWTLWQGQMDFSACARQIGPNAPRGKAGSVARAAKRLPQLVPKEKDLLTPPEGNRYFWCSDYMTHRGKDYFYSVKMASSRVIGAESTNNENLKGKLTADGVTLFRRAGDEYENMMPYWDWHKLPGITAVQDNGKLKLDAKKRNRSEFVGGLSNGTFGFAAMTLDAPELKANKSFFGLGSTFVAMGSGISSDHKASVITVIDQCRTEGGFSAGSASSLRSYNEGVHTFDVERILHKDFNYIFLEKNTVAVDCGSATGNWKSVIQALKEDEITGKRFLAWIDHGAKPKGASYFYIVRPKDAKGNLPEKLKTSSPDIHAVRDPVSGIVMATFFTPGKFTIPRLGDYEVDQPILLMVNKNTVYCADPTGKLEKVRIKTPRATYNHTFDPNRPRETQQVFPRK